MRQAFLLMFITALLGNMILLPIFLITHGREGKRQRDLTLVGAIGAFVMIGFAAIIVLLLIDGGA